MSALLFSIPPQPSVPVKGETARYPVNRIFCVGRNYAAHAAEMGIEVDREAPFYFTKTPSAIVMSGETIPYPPGTDNYHYEIELVIAIGHAAFNVSKDEAASAVFGYACGLDMTRRDLQLKERAKQRPWDLGKDVENSAVISEITPVAEVGEIGPQRIWLSLNGDVKQDAHLTELVWKVLEMISHLSGYYHLAPGDLIYTGTPAGVGPVVPGDIIKGGIDGLAPISVKIGDAK